MKPIDPQDKKINALIWALEECHLQFKAIWLMAAWTQKRNPEKRVQTLDLILKKSEKCYKELEKYLKESGAIK